MHLRTAIAATNDDEIVLDPELWLEDLTVVDLLTPVLDEWTGAVVGFQLHDGAIQYPMEHKGGVPEAAWSTR